MLACLSRRRTTLRAVPGFKTHRGRSTWHGVSIRQSDQAQTLVDGGSSPSRATRSNMPCECDGRTVVFWNHKTGFDSLAGY